MNNRPITGKINDQVTFVAENFRFTFVSTGNMVSTLPVDENGCIWGRTNNFNSKYIGIYTGKDIDLQFGACVVNVWHYILTSLAPEQLVFNAIKFENGAINIVNPCNALQKDFAKEEELNKAEEQKVGSAKNGRREKYYVYKEHRDSKEFTVPTLSSGNEENETVKWIFTSKIEQSMSIDAGDTLKNDTAALLIVFEKEKKLNTFIDYYRYVTDLLAFLTFRRSFLVASVSFAVKRQIQRR